MNRMLLIGLAAGTIAQAHAATTEKYWEKCPGPSCPATTAPTEYERSTADGGRRPASADDQGKDAKSAMDPGGKAAPQKAEPKSAKPAQELRMKGY